MRTLVWVILAGLTPMTAAAAESCVEQVDRFAAAHGLAANLPHGLGDVMPGQRPAALDSSGTAGAAAESGGGTATTAEQGAADSGEASQLLHVQRLLTTARASGIGGASDQCFDLLRRAEAAWLGGPEPPGGMGTK